MITATKRKLASAPTPMAGLALGIGSILWCWESGAQLHGYGQITGAVIAALMLLILIAKFLVHPKLLWNDLPLRHMKRTTLYLMLPSNAA